MQEVQVNPNRVSHNTASSCGYCNKTDQKLLKCARCHFVLYCNRECQTKHWPTHKLDCHSKFIHVVQDSAAILLNKTTSKTIQYLFTNGLESCIAIMAKGEHGVVLLHDGGRLTENSIKAVFQRLGTLEFWATSANPNAGNYCSKIRPDLHQAFIDKFGGFYTHQIKRIRQIMTAIDANARSKQKKPDDSDYYRASEKWVCINRNGEIYTQINPEINKCMIMEESTLILREKISELNSTLAKNELDCHLQFDGVNFTPIPQLILSEETIQSIAQTNQMVANCLENYRKAVTIFSSLGKGVAT
jgi:hypothetical protein